jgi:hypothetical protein
VSFDRDDCDEPRPRRRWSCRGWAEWYGPCGDLECDGCYPGRALDDDEDDDGEDDDGEDDDDGV